ncbi:DUF3048 domain-containing protein [Streptomyces sp. HPF1205]|uniref:DUF3048 domain-containing protein n=1 Tax=Streptomyces sp. HPF1205 TaxID=2873262 RepID=UPI001CED7221|nr:DUF3048 domain-containing protein [Streptomyces sp. HPF1205]
MRRQRAVGAAAAAGAVVLVLVTSCTGGGGTAPTTGPGTSGSSAPATSYLTGEPGAAGKVLAVKIDNVGAARPQTGLNSADIVYGIEVEGGLSRLMAVFDGNHLPPVVGPVRSARETDLQILPQYGRPVLAFSGAQSQLLPVLKADKDIAAVTGTSAFFRSPDRPAPHNEYLRTKGVADRAAPARDIGLRFAAAPPPGGTAGTSASAAMPSARFAFTWNGSRYRVAMDGAASPWTADNVIIQHVTVKESRFHSRTGFVPFSQTVGSGSAQVLRDGRSYQARWTRPTQSAGTTYTVNGRTVTLHPGRTWIILAP